MIYGALTLKIKGHIIITENIEFKIFQDKRQILKPVR